MDLSLSRKLSILAYLAASGPIKLRELAAHYGIDGAKMYQELNDLFLVELTVSGGYESPIDLTIGDSYSLDNYVSLAGFTSQNLQKINLGFDELLSVLAWIDFLLPVADQKQYTALSKLREHIVAGAEKSGYASALWPLPEYYINRKVVDYLNLALEQQNDVRFQYWKANPDTPAAFSQEVTGTPLELVAAVHPLLHLRIQETTRTYRIDRITDIEIIAAKHNRKILNSARVKARKAEFNFHGGTATLLCTQQAQWIIDSYPGITRISAADLENETVQTIRLAVEYNNLNSLLAILIRLGSSVLELEPKDLAAKIAQRAKNIGAIYSVCAT